MRVRAFCLPFLPLSCTIAVLLPVNGETAQPATPADKKPKTDLYGDPLPPGAVARLGTIQFRHEGEVYAIAFSPDGKTLASGSTDGTIRLWEVATGKELFKMGGHGGDVLCVAFSPDGARLASGHTNRAVLIWDVAALLKGRN